MSLKFSGETESALRNWIQADTFDSGRFQDEARFYRFVHSLSNDHRTLADESDLRSQLTSRIDAFHVRADEVALEKNVRKWVREIQTIMAYRAALEADAKDPAEASLSCDAFQTHECLAVGED